MEAKEICAPPAWWKVVFGKCRFGRECYVAARKIQETDSLEGLVEPGKAPEFVSTEALRQLPRFDDAVALLVDRLAELYGDERRLVRSLLEYERAVTFMLAICIAMNARDDEPASWLGVATLAEDAKLLGIGPPRLVRKFVEEMRADGYLLHQAMPGDRRRHRLLPTERMLAVDREWIAAFHAPLALLFPDEPRYRAAMLRDPAYHRAYRAASLQTLRIARATITAHPAVDSFLHQVAGARVLTLLMQLTRGSPDGWSPPGFYSRVAERSATTRVHVRNMLRAAARDGLVEISEAPELRVRPTPRLRDDFRGWVADSLSSTDLVSAMAPAFGWRP
jgi:hypothetical protein